MKHACTWLVWDPQYSANPRTVGHDTIPKYTRAAFDLPQHRLPSTIYWGFDKLTVIRGIVPPPRNSRVNNTTIRVDVTITSLFSFSISICRLSAKAIAPRSPTILERKPLRYRHDWKWHFLMFMLTFCKFMKCEAYSCDSKMALQLQVNLVHICTYLL